jgi:hypothetical protein
MNKMRIYIDLRTSIKINHRSFPCSILILTMFLIAET